MPQLQVSIAFTSEASGATVSKNFVLDAKGLDDDEVKEIVRKECNAAYDALPDAGGRFIGKAWK